ncbi:MAG: Ig-like domain-containing protein [Luteolibacter sp.]|nr:Ig-like domain-containing protein [Luteolibacter sp.]
MSLSGAGIVAVSGFLVLSLQAGAATVNLAWNANSESDISGYRLSYGTSPGSYSNTVATGAVTTVSVSGLEEGRIYYFSVKAVNQAGLQSVSSSEISYLVPVTPIANQAPVAAGQSVTTTEDSVVAIVLSASDANGDPLSYSIVNSPGLGTLSGSAPNLTYTPKADVNGQDSFTFRASDGKLNSNTATISINITAANDAPVATAQAVATAAGKALAILLTASDKDGDLLSYAIVSSPAKGTLSGTAPNLTYTPNAGAGGSDSFTFRASDGKLISNTATISINITSATNSAPVAAAQTVSTTEDTAVAIRLSASDANGDPLTFGIVSSPAKGTLSGSVTNLTYTPKADVNGSDSFTFRVNDGKAYSNTATVTINIAAVNDVPVAVAKTVNATEDTAVAIVLAASDKDGDALTYGIVSAPGNGTLSGSAPNLTYTPKADANGADSFTYRASDGKEYSATVTVSITIQAVNDAPIATAQTVSTTVDKALAIVLAASDKDGDPLTYSIVSSPSKGTLSGTAPNLTYTPKAGASGSDSFTFRASDGKLNSNTANVSITFTSVANTAPVAASKAVSTAADKPLSIILTASDANDDPLTYRIVSSPSKGTLSGTAPNLTYTPKAGASGSDSFTFRASDGKVNSNTATVSITLTAPPAVTDDELPAPWLEAKIGAVNPAAKAAFASGLFTIQGSGTLADTADTGNFVWLTLKAGGQIIVNVTELADATSGSRVGVMMRDSLAPNAKHVFMGVDGAGDYHWGHRKTASGPWVDSIGPKGSTSNVWLALKRAGSKITAYKSENGRKWQSVGQVNQKSLTLEKYCYIGFWVSSGSQNLCTATFKLAKITP